TSGSTTSRWPSCWIPVLPSSPRTLPRWARLPRKCCCTASATPSAHRRPWKCPPPCSPGALGSFPPGCEQVDQPPLWILTMAAVVALTVRLTPARGSAGRGPPPPAQRGAPGGRAAPASRGASGLPARQRHDLRLPSPRAQGQDRDVGVRSVRAVRLVDDRDVILARPADAIRGQVDPARVVDLGGLDLPRGAE